MGAIVEEAKVKIDVEVAEQVDIEAVQDVDVIPTVVDAPAELVTVCLGGDDVAVLGSKVSVDIDSQPPCVLQDVLGDEVDVVACGPAVNLDSVIPCASQGKPSDEINVVGRGPAVNIDSDSDEGSSSSSSSGRSRSRSRDRGNKSLGAAAATALLTAAAPLDVDECDRIVENTLCLPTSFAMQLHHEGGTVAIMAETGAVISVSPKDSQDSVLQVSGVAEAVGKAVWQLQQLHETHVQEATAAAAASEAAAAMEHLERLEIPARHMSAVLGPNGASIADVRSRCGGIMIAMQPPSEPGGPLTAVIGPGERANVLLARRELRKRLEAAAPPMEAPNEAAPAAPKDTSGTEASRSNGAVVGTTSSSSQPWQPSVSGLPVPLGPPTLHKPPEPVLAMSADNESEDEDEMYEL